MIRQAISNRILCAQVIISVTVFRNFVKTDSAILSKDVIKLSIGFFNVVGSTQMNLLTVPVVAEQPDHAFRPVRTICKGAALGAVIMSSISRLLVFIGLPSTYDNTITGIMLIVIVVVDALAQRRSVEMARRKRLLSRTAEHTPEGGAVK